MSMYESEIQEGADWRWSEVLDLAPAAIMQELLELDTVILDLYHACREARRALVKAQDELKMVEDAAVEEAQARDDLNKGEAGYAPLVDGSNQAVRDRKVRVYLPTQPAVLSGRQEVERLSTEADDAEGALDAMKDRQSNLRQWSRMYVATTELLTSVRPQGEVLLYVPEPVDYAPLPDEPYPAASGGEPLTPDVADAIGRYRDVAF